MKTLTEDRVRSKIAALLKKSGSQAKAAARIGISQSYFNDLLHGRRALSDAVLAKLGIVRVTRYSWNPAIKVEVVPS